MGLLDLPGPLLTWADSWMSALPGLAKLAVWGAAAGVVSMWMYRAVSPQQRIALGREQQLAVRHQLDEFDGELAEAWPLIRRLLSLSFAQVGRVAGPAVLASLPVLVVLVWLSNAYGYRFPESAAPDVHATPDAVQVSWLDGSGKTIRDATPRIRLTDPANRHSAEVTVAAPVPVIERWRWWNVLVGNPAGYLDASHPAQRVEIDLPRQVYLTTGPGWMRGWEFPFFVSLLAVSLALKRVLGIH